VGTWIVGMGRYWDDPGAKLLQHLGLGSIIYIFVLAFIIWLIIQPYHVPNWTYFRVLTFISLTSFPAIFYAIPVERFFAITTANTINVWFLAIVAARRLALLFFFLRRFTDLSIIQVLTTTLLPICVIIASLTALNLHRVVFNIMGGVRNQSAHDAAYLVLVFLTFASTFLVIPLLLSYIIGVYGRWKNRRSKKEAQ
ncbi:MAG: hypothetical protein AAF985_22960, partial [Bacteroidota bacterium]